MIPANYSDLVNPNAWSLRHELYFYFAFSILLLRPSRLRLWGITAFAGMHLVSYYKLSDLNPDTQFNIFPSLYPLYFCQGCIIAFIFNKFQGKALRNISALMLIGFSSLALVSSLSLELPLNLWENHPERICFFSGVYGAVIVSLLLIEQRRQLPIPRIFLEIGDASYSIYLLHLLPVLILDWTSIPASLFQLTGTFNWIFLLAPILINIGIIAYRYVEKPLLEKAKF